MNVFGYVRVSGKVQVAGDGPERQRDAISAFCAAHGLTAVREFFDAGVSGTVDGEDREAFSQLVEALIDNPGAVEAVVIERQDRLARDLMAQEVMLKLLRDQGIKVFCVDRGSLEDIATNDTDPTRVLIRQIFGALAQWEKTALVLKLRKAKERIKARTGKSVDGRKPYGHRPGEKQVLDMVRTIWHSEPEMNYGILTDHLNALNVRNRYGGVWKPQRVRDLVLKMKERGQLT